MSEREFTIPEGRLQRASLKTDKYISKFRQVLFRHGMTMSLISTVYLLIQVNIFFIA